MKKSIYFLLPFILFASCVKETECCVSPNPELVGRFIHEIPDCENADGSETNCTEWLEFVSDSEADIQYGGIDRIQRFIYSINLGSITLEGPATSSFKPVFEIRDTSTLERIDNGDMWKKQ